MRVCYQRDLPPSFDIKTYFFVYLKDYIYHYDNDRVSKVEKKPDLNVLDGGSNGKAVGYRDVDGGQDHHAGDVDSDHKIIIVFPVICDLVDKVHQDCGEIRDHEYTGNVSSQINCELQTCSPLFQFPSLDIILTNRSRATVS